MKPNSQITFSNKDSIEIKGIAIILMMIHHCFGSVDRFEAYNISFFPFTDSQFIKIASSFKMCVSLFAFITAYGLTQSLKVAVKNQNMYQWYSKRFIKLFSGYWFAVIVMSIVCEIFGHYTSKIFFDEGVIRGVFYLILQFFGLSSILGTPMLIGTWWYIGAAVVFVLVIPLIWRISQEKYGALFLLTAPFLLTRVQTVNGSGYPGGETPYTFLYIVILGVLAAEKDWFEQYAKRYKHNEFRNFIFFTIMLLVFYRICLSISPSRFWEINYNILPFILIIYCWCYIIQIPILNNVLEFLGKYSMDIFYYHTFIRWMYFNDFIYSFKYFIFVIIALLVASILAAILVEKIKTLIRYDKVIHFINDYISNKLEKIAL